MANRKQRKADEGLVARYLNPMTDYGFKRLFGEKEIMMAFLNDLLQLPSPISDITFLDKEMDATTKDMRGVVYDLRCSTAKGEEFIVEMQNRGQKFFADRILYYLSRSISNQKESGGGDWDFNLKPIYGVFFLNFHLEGFQPKEIRSVRFQVEGTGEIFTDSIRAYTLELPDFRNKPEDYPKSKIEYWLYNLANMETMTTALPFQSQQPVFGKMGTLAELAKLSKPEITRYFTSLDNYRTQRAVLSFEHEKGYIEGREEGREEGEAQKAISIAKNMLGLGMSAEVISQCTGLTEEKIESLKDN